MKIFLFNLLLGCTLVSLTGCVGYRLGSLLPEDIRTVYVPTFVNKTNEPFVDVETTRSVIQEIQLDGSLRIADEANADSILEVTVYDFSLKPLAFSKERQRTLADEFRITLTAAVVLKRRVTDEIIVEHPAVRGESTFVLTGDISSSKRLALPEAADDLAHDIVEQIVEVW